MMNLLKEFFSQIITQFIQSGEEMKLIFVLAIIAIIAMSLILGGAISYLFFLYIREKNSRQKAEINFRKEIMETIKQDSLDREKLRDNIEKEVDKWINKWETKTEQLITVTDKATQYINQSTETLKNQTIILEQIVSLIERNQTLCNGGKDNDNGKKPGE